MRPVIARVTPVNPVAYVRLGQFHGAALAVQAVIEEEVGYANPGPEAAAYLARTVGGNEGGNFNNICNLINGLVADGVWSKLDCLYVLAQQNVTDAKLNLIGSTNALTGSATFTAYKGFSAFSAGMDTGFNGSTLNKDAYSFGSWQYDTPANGQLSIGTSTTGVSLTTDDGGAISASLSGMFAYSFAAIAAGFISVETTSSATADIYFNGTVPGGGVGGATTAVEAQTFLVGGARGSGNNTATTLSAAYISKLTLGATLQLAFYNRLRTYMTAVGVP